MDDRVLFYFADIYFWKLEHTKNLHTYANKML
jgi:hypothetical protein